MQGHCEWHAEVLAPLIDEFEAVRRRRTQRELD
jgi:hypothetical protein